MDWEAVGAITGILALAFLILVEWPRLRQRLSWSASGQITWRPMKVLLGLLLVAGGIGVIFLVLSELVEFIVLVIIGTVLGFCLVVAGVYLVVAGRVSRH